MVGVAILNINALNIFNMPISIKKEKLDTPQEQSLNLKKGKKNCRGAHSLLCLFFVPFFFKQ